MSWFRKPDPDITEEEYVFHEDDTETNTVPVNGYLLVEVSSTQVNTGEIVVGTATYPPGLVVFWQGEPNYIAENLGFIHKAQLVGKLRRQ